MNVKTIINVSLGIVPHGFFSCASVLYIINIITIKQKLKYSFNFNEINDCLI